MRRAKPRDFRVWVGMGATAVVVAVAPGLAMADAVIATKTPQTTSKNGSNVGVAQAFNKDW